MTFKITNSEFKKRLGFILLGFFTFYLVDPIREWIKLNINMNPFLIGIGGILLALYLFDF